MIINVEGPVYKNDILHCLPQKAYFYIDINNVDNLKNFNVPKDAINDNNVNFLLDCCMEGYQSIISLIYNIIVIQNKIPEERIFLASGAYDITSIVKKEAAILNRKPFTSVHVNFFEIMVSRNMQNSDIKQGIAQVHKNKRKQGYIKSFICLNRVWRLHRIALIGMLLKRNLLQKGYVSLTKYNDSPEACKWNDWLFDSLLTTHSDNEEIVDFFKNEQEKLKNLTPLIIDSPTLYEASTNRLKNELNFAYENSYFSLVTETNFYTQPERCLNHKNNCEGTRFFSEKIFKPMAYKHPFILLCVPQSLDYLRDLGYQTFHPFINESYDTEKDDGKRLLMILDEVSRLCYLKEQELQQFLSDVEPICEHNFKVLERARDKAIV